jgi:16S rRNA (uracil1498-N3)-methyltransferase
VIEAAKQCGRNRLMRIAAPQPWSDWITNATAGRRLLAHLAGQPSSQILLREPVATQIAIGPEGGFTVAEVAAAVAAGWQPVSLGPRILRIETAAVALASACALR